MFTRLNLKTICAAMLLTGLTSNANAFEDVLYVGAGIGSSFTNISNAWIPSGSDESKTSISDRDSASRIFFGAKFSEHFGYEIGYIDFGKQSIAFYNAGESSQSSDITAFQLSLLVRHNIRDRAEISFRISAAQANVKYSSSGVSGYPYGINESVTSTGTGFGIGVNVKIAPAYSVRFDWENFKGIGPGRIYDDKLGIYSLSLLREF